MRNQIPRIAIFASGSGTNAQNLIEYFRCAGTAEVVVIATNNPNAFVIQRAEKLQVAVCIFNRVQFYESGYVLDFLLENMVDFIVLAGFLWLIPITLIHSYNERILNIHPALLPKYGGKGMYGDKVHKAVLENNEIETGITIHLVNQKFDEGRILFQAKTNISGIRDVNRVAQKVHDLEYLHFPKVVENYILTFNEKLKVNT